MRFDFVLGCFSVVFGERKGEREGREARRGGTGGGGGGRERGVVKRGGNSRHERTG